MYTYQGKLNKVYFSIAFALLSSGCNASNLSAEGEWTANESQAALTPPMGWNTWYAYRVDISQSKVEDSMEIIKQTGLLKKGYKYINLDDGWWLKRTSDGIQIRTDRFPITDMGDGKTSFKPWTDKLHEQGFKAGIYTEIGRNTCGQYWDRQSPTQPEGEGDELNVGLFGRIESDIKMYFDSWGFDYIKVDACGVADFTRSRLTGKYDHNGQELVNKYTPFEPPYITRGNIKVTQNEKIETIFGNINNALLKNNPDKDFLLSICTWGTANVKEWGKNYGTSWRTGDDLHPTMRSVIGGIDGVKARALYAQPGSWNDPDILQLGNGEFGPSNANYIENSKFHMGMWAILNAPLLISTELQKVPQEILNILGNEKVIAINQDKAGHQANLAWWGGNGKELYVKQLETYGQKAVALINRWTNTSPVTISWEKLKMKPGTPITFTNVWSNESFTKTEDFSMQVDPYTIDMWVIEGTPLIDNGYFLSSLPGRINVAEDGVGDQLQGPPSNVWQGSSNIAGWGGARIDHSPWDKQIQFPDQAKKYGIGILSNSRMEFKNNKEFKQFTTTVGVDTSSSGGQSGVKFKVYGDGRLLEEAEVVKGAMSKELTVDISNVTIMELVVVHPAAEDEGRATVAWADAIVTK